MVVDLDYTASVAVDVNCGGVAGILEDTGELRDVVCAQQHDTGCPYVRSVVEVTMDPNNHRKEGFCWVNGGSFGLHGFQIYSHQHSGDLPCG